MSEIKVNSIKGVGASAAALSIHNSDGTCTLASGSKLNNCTTDGTTNLTIADGNLVLGTSGHGIDFSATSGTGTSELFDDYEIGSFTPTIGSGTCTFTGNYVKIGDLVNIQIFARGFSDHTSSTSISFGGLPFTSSSSNSATGAVFTAYVSHSDNIACHLSSSGTTLSLFTHTSGGNYSSMTHSMILDSGTNRRIFCSINYLAA